MTRYPQLLTAALFWLTFWSGLMVGGTGNGVVTQPDPDQISIEPVNGPAVDLTGGPGAVDPGSEGSNQLRVTRVGGEPVEGPTFVEVEIDPDGSFAAELPGNGSELFYFELITPDEDLFLITLQNGFDNPTQEADPGPNHDHDSSPDTINCAPDDDSYRGQRCP